MLQFTYKIAKQSDSVVVLGGGPSSGSNVKYISQYIKENHSLVYAANYNHPGISSDYTYLGNGKRFILKIKTIKSPIIIVNPWTETQIKNMLKENGVRRWKIAFNDMWDEAHAKHQIYRMGRGNARDNRHLTKWRGRSDGSFNFFPSPAGFATFVLSTVSKPKEVLIAGLDGPDDPRPGKILYKRNFNGHIKRYRSWSAFKYKQRTLSKLALPYVQRRGAEVVTFANSELWGLDAKKHNIRVIQ